MRFMYFISKLQLESTVRGLKSPKVCDLDRSNQFVLRLNAFGGQRAVNLKFIENQYKEEEEREEDDDDDDDDDEEQEEEEKEEE
ncbi:hypothetical protein ElyMa_005972200 [Elysia marginata]|uniref:Brix domain-containing protein n=1 Tax=Elysia marginata TaxID=1093978 RepID=A0AAV4GCP7_9GAST|nr:hypothetical protein ElyMa_005972200 [Elysia marginata]